jgi:hypothetical protein
MDEGKPTVYFAFENDEELKFSSNFPLSKMWLRALWF